MRKGIVLAGGNGTRLWPITKVVSKHLLPIFDKPMIYYPITTLMLAGIKDILIISMTRDINAYKALLGDGSQWGINFSYAIQDEARGIADAFIVGRDFIGDSDVALILGDNIFYGHYFGQLLKEVGNKKSKATIFAYRVTNPRRYGVVEFNSSNKVISLEEKPSQPKSSYAIPGLYFYDNGVVNITANLTPSARGELEITDVNKIYLHNNELDVQIIPRGFAWFDSGTNESLLEASNFIKIIEERQGLKIGCPNEIAFRMGYISALQLQGIAEKLNNQNSHYVYLKQIAEENI